MRARRDLLPDFLQVFIHRFGVDARHDDGGTNPSVGAYGTEQMHGVMAGVRTMAERDPIGAQT